MSSQASPLKPPAELGYRAYLRAHARVGNALDVSLTDAYAVVSCPPNVDAAQWLAGWRRGRNEHLNERALHGAAVVPMPLPVIGAAS
jgi:hypothetical protein